MPQQVIDAISEYLSKWNANLGGAFLTSQRSDLIVEQAHQAMADFFNCSPDEVVFGANMTTLTFALSRAIGRDLKGGDELLVTCLDHDANVSPWVCLEERGAKVRTADIKTADCTLDMFDLQAKIRRSTRLVAVGWAANAVGTINDVREAIRLAHAVGAMTFIDAVHYAPHGLIDVKAHRHATFWPAPATSSSVRIRASSTASANSCSVCVPTSCASAARNFPIAGRRARRTTSAWPE